MASHCITIVEDNRIVAADLQAMLVSMGFAINGSFSKGSDALEHIFQNPPDLILMDIHIKGDMNGIEVAQRIAENQDIPIVYVTAYADPETLAKAKVANPYGYIVKPIQLEDLRSTIEIALNKVELEQQLKKQEEWYRTILNSIGDGVIVTDGEETIRYMNPVSEKLTGWNFSEARGKKLAEVFSLIKEEAVKSPLEYVDPFSLYKQGENNDIFLLQKNKDLIPIEFRVSHLSFEKEEQGTVIIFKDESREREIRKILQERKDYFQLLYDNSPIAYQSLNDQGLILEVNPAWIELLGYQKEDVLSTSFNNYIIEEHRNNFTRWLSSVLDGPTSSLFTCKIKISSENYITVELSAKKGEHHQSETNLIHCAINNISAQIESTAALEEAHQCLLTILDGIDAHIGVCDAHSHEVIFMNKAMQRDYEGNYITEKCWSAFRGEKDICKDCTNDMLLKSNKVPTESIVYEREYPNLKKTLILREKLIYWIDGHVVKLQVASDVTQRKKLEAQLRQAQKMESIGTLAGGIAHDFNNILSAVLGFSQLALDESEKGSSLNSNIQEVLTAGLRAKALVKHILGFARQTDGVLQPVQVALMAKETLSLIRSTIPSTIEVRSSIDSNSLIMSDPSQLHQVFMNLCTNAAQAMEDSGGILEVNVDEVFYENTQQIEEIKAENLSVPGNYLRISISDTGTGIAPEIMHKIYDPYFTTKEPGEGTGMGLAMVHGVVKSLKGEISVKSAPGTGTMFTIYFPIGKKENVIDEEEKDIPTGTEHILFVDDELPIVKVGCRTLEVLGYKASYSTDSYEALMRFQHNPMEFDLVITDMTMPNLTGDQLAIELIRIRPNIPIILCTGYSKKIVEKGDLPESIKAVLIKPIQKEKLAITIREVLDKQDQ